MECLLCNGVSQKKLSLCLPCQQDLPWHPSPTVGFYYQPPIDYWISQLKFGRQLHYASLLGRLFINKLQQYWHNNLPEIIMPIPLHVRRLCQRGFNQSLEIAKPISRFFDITLDRRSLKRVRYTQPQSELSGKQRQQNVQRAFQIQKTIQLQHVVLFDDVITTGSTMIAAYQAVKLAGVKCVELWGCAST